METHSSILARRIPWTEEPDRLRSIGLQRVRHCFVTGPTHTHASPGTQSFQAIRASNAEYEGQNIKKIWGKGAQTKQKQFRNKQDISKPYDYPWKNKRR